MLAITLQPRTPNSARLEHVDEPSGTGSLLVESVALGICGTDAEILRGEHGEAPHGRDRFILGHESLGRVVEAPANSGFSRGDLVVGIVRHPDPVPCENCAIGEWDMCRNGQFTERGIKEADGFGAEQWRIEPEFAVRVDENLGLLGVLLEPASILAKAWEHIERIGRRAAWSPRTVLVTGAGPIGLLAALLGTQRGLDVHIFDRNRKGIKPQLGEELGVTWHSESLAKIPFQPDIIVECTGAPALLFELAGRTARNGIVCLTGLSTSGRPVPADAGLINRTLVLENDVIFGSVNANRRHYEQGAEALARADAGWLSRLITRRVPLQRWQEALDDESDDVKVVIDFTIS